MLVQLSVALLFVIFILFPLSYLIYLWHKMGIIRKNIDKSFERRSQAYAEIQSILKDIRKTIEENKNV